MNSGYHISASYISYDMGERRPSPRVYRNALPDHKFRAEYTDRRLVINHRKKAFQVLIVCY